MRSPLKHKLPISQQLFLGAQVEGTIFEVIDIEFCYNFRILMGVRRKTGVKWRRHVLSIPTVFSIISVYEHDKPDTGATQSGIY